MKLIVVQVLDPLKHQKMLLKNIILAYFESSPYRIAVKKVCILSFFVFLKLPGFKNAISLKIRASPPSKKGFFFHF